MLQRTVSGSLATLGALLALGLSGCGQATVSRPAQTAAAGIEARVSPAARDKMCQMLIREYNGIQWYQDAEKKQLLLEAIVGTGSDLAVDLLIKEYEGIQWYQDKARKMMFLDLIKKLAASPVDPTSPTDSVETKVAAASRFSKKGPTTRALFRMAESLKKDLSDAPAEAKGKIQAIISHIQIISPNTGR